MTPIYFPFTYASAPSARRLAAVFETLALLAPSRALAADALAPGVEPAAWRVDVPPGDERRLALMEAALRQWAERNTGADLAAMMAAGAEGPPFFPETAVGHIRSQLRARLQGDAAEEPVDPLSAARVFLAFAHALDRDQALMREEFQSLARMERDMLAQLHGAAAAGDGKTAGVGAPEDEDPGAFLTERRIAAWGRLAAAAAPPGEVFVTDSRAVAGALADDLPDLRPLFDLAPSAAGPPDGRAALTAILADALAGGAPTAGGAPLLLCPPAPPGRVFALERSPADFYRALAAGRAPGRGADAGGRCLLVVLGRS